MLCMHLWRLSLRCDFPQALGIARILPSHTFAFILSDPACMVLILFYGKVRVYVSRLSPHLVQNAVTFYLLVNNYCV